MEGKPRSCDLINQPDLFDQIKNVVRELQESTGKEYSVSLEDIARTMGISQEYLLTYLAIRADSGEFVNMDLFIRFNE